MTIEQQQQFKQEIIEEQDHAHTQSYSFCNNFFRISKFYQQKNKITTVAVLSFKYLLPLIILIKDISLSEETTLISLLLQILTEYSIPFYALITFNKFLIASTIYALYQQTFFQTAMTTEVVRVFRTKLRGLIEIDYNVSMFLMSFEMGANLPNFILSLGIYIFACIYLENYINKQDLFYCSSCRANVFYRLLLTAGYLLAAFLLADHTNANSLKVAISLYTAVMIVWFYRYGSQLYPSEVTSKGMIGFMSFLISANLLLVQKQLQAESVSIYSFVIKIVVTFSVVLSAFLLIIKKRSQNRTNKQYYHISELKEIFNDVFINECSVEMVAFLYGRIQLHKKKCENLTCELHSFDLRNQKILMSDENWGISNLIKSYFRCLYESHLGSQPSDSSLLDYLEYLYSEKNPNQYKMTLILSKIDIEDLDIFERSSLYDLRRNIERFFKNKMDELYEGRLHFEQTLDFDKHCLQIQKSINYLVSSNMKIYRHLQQQQIDLNVVFQIIRDNFNIEKQLNKQWLTVSSNLKHQKQLTIAYFHYKQLIKNQHLTRKDINLMNLDEITNVKDQSIFLSDGNYFNPAILFHKETIIFTCTILNDRLLFKDSNYNFEYYLGFNKEEIFQSSIDQILNDDLKEVHEASFKSWMGSNTKTTFDQANFQFKKTECLTKTKEVLPALKYFKSYLNNDSEIEFVCMLKINRNIGVRTVHQIIDFTGNQEPVKQKRQISFSLKQSHNFMEFSNEHAIFIKEKQFQPNSKLSDIINIKIIMAVFFVLISISLIVFHVITVADAGKLQDYSQQYITFMQCYRYPMILGNNYLQSILGIGNQTKIANQISQLSAAFAQLSSNQIILKTLYDLNINLPNNYYPYESGKLNANQPLKFDQIEIFYLISSSITSLTTPIDPNSQDFITFDQFITPAYDNMINGTKHRFHESFIDYINQIIMSELIIDILQFSLAVLFMLIMVNRIKFFMVKMKMISDAIVYFKQEDLEKILNYWIQTDHNFRYIFGKYTHRAVKRRHKKIVTEIKKEKNDSQEQYMNRINKTIIQSKHFNNFNKITISCIIIGTLLIAASLSGTQFSRMSSLNYLIYFQSQGNLFLRYFPTATIVGYGSLSKYRSLQHPQIPFNPDRFEGVLQAMRLVGQFSYIPNVKNGESAYFSKQRNYFFGNPCTYNPAVINKIGVSVATCQSIINGSFSRGLTSYMREGYIMADGYIQGIRNYNASQLSEFSQSVSILSAYILDAISTWGTQFSQNLENLVAQQNIFTLLNFIVLFAVFIIIYWYFFIRFLQREYEFYRYMFLKMIPEYVLRADKVARQAFINFNILE